MAEDRVKIKKLAPKPKTKDGKPLTLEEVARLLAEKQEKDEA